MKKTSISLEPSHTFPTLQRSKSYSHASYQKISELNVHQGTATYSLSLNSLCFLCFREGDSQVALSSIEYSKSAS